MFVVYILESLKDGSYYTGHTENLEERLERHNAGMCRYTRRAKPFELLYTEVFATRSEAMRREKEIKGYKGGNSFKKLIRGDS
jgi:putative endonuclease